MGTRAVTNVIDEDGTVYVSLYRQFDGYPDGHGKELGEFLKDAIIGNGIGSNVPVGFFNGVGDLACRLVSFFKDDHRSIGSFYIIPAGSGWGPDYTYNVTARGPKFGEDPSAIEIEVVGYSDRPCFSGSIEEFRAWAANPEEDFE